MDLLLDTCAFLWIVSDAEELSQAAREAFRAPQNRVFLSVVSAWEIAVKHGLGKLPLPAPPERFVPMQREAHGIAPLPLDEAAALRLPELPDRHRDPFDRMLICQALQSNLVLLTPDPLITGYPVQTLW